MSALIPAHQVTLRRQVILGIVGALLLFAGVEVLWYRNIKQLVSGLEWVTRKNRLLASIDGAFVSLKEAEVAEREYTITGDRVSLAAFHETEIRVQDQIRDIAVMSADDPVRAGVLAFHRKAAVQNPANRAVRPDNAVFLVVSAAR